MKMTTEEAFVKVLQMHGLEHAFGIIGSAMMPVSDLFPAAGITFWDCAHENTAGMIADGYARASGKMAVAIAQNGPGITNFVTAIASAYWNHTPLLLITPQAANKTMGKGGFQEMEQMNLFKDIVCYQEQVLTADRMAETLDRVIRIARENSAPAQINVPRDLWTQIVDIELPQPMAFEPSRGGKNVIEQAAKLLSEARFPVILNGCGVILSGGVEASVALAEKLDAPVCCSYQHNDAFPGDHRLHLGPLGYNGSKAAMRVLAQADVVLALGTRLNPFSTLPCYGLDYWPTKAKVIQVDINARRLGLTKPITLGIQGDARLVATEILEQLSEGAGDADRQARCQTIASAQDEWATELTQLEHELDDAGTQWNKNARASQPNRMSPRQAWQIIQKTLPDTAIISTDIGNNCAIGNAYPNFSGARQYLAPGMFGSCGYGFPAVLGAKIARPNNPAIGFAGDGAFGISLNELTACGRAEWPAVTMVVFRNYQWGAEKRNTTLWYDNNFVGTELDKTVEFAQIAEACGLKGIKVETQAAFEDALKTAIDAQMQQGVTTLIEVVLNQELGEPFRRDAMRKPTVVAGISRDDMQPQATAFSEA